MNTLKSYLNIITQSLLTLRPRKPQTFPTKAILHKYSPSKLYSVHHESILCYLYVFLCLAELFNSVPGSESVGPGNMPR